MAAHNFTGTALDEDATNSPAMKFSVAQHFYFDSKFKASVAPDGVYLAEDSSGHKVKLSGGPYTGAQLQDLWRGLSQVGFGPR